MYLIDGNNVMGQWVGWHRDKEAARRRLLTELADFAINRKVRVSVVFDGQPARAFPDGSSYRGVKIFYARQGSDADSRLVEIVEGSRERSNMTVITSDRQLTARIRVSGVKVLRSGEFRKWVDETREAARGQGQNETGRPPGSERSDDEELSRWFKYFGVDPDDD